MKKSFTIRYIVRIGILSALAAIIMMLKFPLPFLPPFYKLDFSEIIVLIGAMAMGPLAGVLIELIKGLINVLIDGSVTMGIGEISNFLMGCAFVLPASLIYKYHKTKKWAFVSICIGFASMLIVSTAANYWLIIPAYASVFGGMDNVIKGAAKSNESINNILSLITLGTIPFNFIKGFIASALVLLLYKPVSPLLKEKQ